MRITSAPSVTSSEPAVARDVAEREPEQRPADQRARRALQAADHRGGEAEDEHGVERVGRDEDRRRDEHAGQRARHRRPAPSRP